MKRTTPSNESSNTTVLAGADNVESCYFNWLLSSIAPAVSGLFRPIRGKHHSLLPLLSLVVVLASSALVLNTVSLGNIWRRVLLASALHLALIVEVSDHFLRGSADRFNRLDAWLGNVLNRLGTMILFASFGFAAWRLYDSPLFIYLGIAAGYAPSLCSLAIAGWEYAFLDEKSTPPAVRSVAFSGKIRKQPGREQHANTEGSRILSALRCFLNPGTGERYLLLTVFVLVGRVDIMLGVAALLSCTQAVTVYRAVREMGVHLSEKTRGKTE